MSPQSSVSSSRTSTARRLAILPVLLLLTLACALPGVSSVDTQATSIALGVQASEIAAQATALEIQRQAMQAGSPTQPPEPTVDLAQTEQASQATASVEEPTQSAPILPSDTPAPVATEAGPAPEAIAITSWQMQYWVPLSSGCEIKDAPCWKLFDDWKTTQGQNQAFLTSKEDVLIPENWSQPYLTFLNKRELRFEAKITLIVDGKPIDVRIIPKGTVQTWKEDYIDLANYKGKKVRVQFECPVGMEYINSWFIQNVQIVPDYTPAQ